MTALGQVFGELIGAALLTLFVSTASLGAVLAGLWTALVWLFASYDGPCEAEQPASGPADEGVYDFPDMW